MYPVERHQKLISILSAKGFSSIHDLAQALGVSEITIRRDLQALHQQGLVEKVSGGGQISRSTSEQPFMNKRILQQAEKARIAEEGLTLLESGMTVGLSAGTTTWTLAQRIKLNTQQLRDLTFVTNSTNIAVALKANGWHAIHLVGGQFRTPSDALVGPMAEHNAGKLHTDLFFLGAHGADLDYGLSCPNLQESSLNRVFMANTASVVTLFDHTKWGVRAFAHLANFDEIDVVVTDMGQHEREIQALRQLGPEVHLVTRVEGDVSEGDVYGG